MAKLNAGNLLGLSLFYKSLQKLHLSNKDGEKKIANFTEPHKKKSSLLGVLSCIVKDLRTVISNM